VTSFNPSHRVDATVVSSPFVFHVKGASVVCDDSTHDRQPQPSPLTWFLGRKIRIEYSIHCLGIHAMPVVDDLQPHVFAGREIAQKKGDSPSSWQDSTRMSKTPLGCCRMAWAALVQRFINP
jgi:hypothetical protein